ncbi:hypothetical protein PENSPDRAFT_694680 [Peniophora sp. CONT]|nr:hypothetical protein PENSPDRAFT_694680 [Peniophora sp. CONT]
MPFRAYLSKTTPTCSIGSTSPTSSAYTILVELLAYQFASPGRWIEAQDLMFSQYKFECFIEIGPSPLARTRPSTRLGTTRSATPVSSTATPSTPGIQGDLLLGAGITHSSGAANGESGGSGSVVIKSEEFTEFRAEQDSQHIELYMRRLKKYSRWRDLWAQVQVDIPVDQSVFVLYHYPTVANGKVKVVPRTRRSACFSRTWALTSIFARRSRL